MSTFNFTPEFSASRNTRPAVTSIKFGDGFEQRVSYGLNQVMETWSLRFQNRTKAEADQIDAFLQEAGGVLSFDWTPPDALTASKWICREWSRSIEKANLYNITATFEKVYDI